MGGILPDIGPPAHHKKKQWRKNIQKRRGESIFKGGGGRKKNSKEEGGINIQERRGEEKNSKEGAIWTPGHQPLAHILSPIPETVRVITWTQLSYEFSPKKSCLELTIPLG